MEIQEKKIKELIPYEKNPRKNDAAVEYVANSIKEFGFKVPIVIDKNGKENKAAIVEYTDVTGKTVKRYWDGSTYRDRPSLMYNSLSNKDMSGTFKSKFEEPKDWRKRSKSK